MTFCLSFSVISSALLGACGFERFFDILIGMKTAFGHASTSRLYSHVFLSRLHITCGLLPKIFRSHTMRRFLGFLMSFTSLIFGFYFMAGATKRRAMTFHRASPMVAM